MAKSTPESEEVPNSTEKNEQNSDKNSVQYSRKIWQPLNRKSQIVVTIGVILTSAIFVWLQLHGEFLPKSPAAETTEKCDQTFSSRPLS